MVMEQGGPHSASTTSPTPFLEKKTQQLPSSNHTRTLRGMLFNLDLQLARPRQLCTSMHVNNPVAHPTHWYHVSASSTVSDDELVPSYQIRSLSPPRTAPLMLQANRQKMAVENPQASLLSIMVSNFFSLKKTSSESAPLHHHRYYFFFHHPPSASSSRQINPSSCPGADTTCSLSRTQHASKSYHSHFQQPCCPTPQPYHPSPQPCHPTPSTF